MTTTVVITDKINGLVESRKGTAGKEGFIHCLLLLSLGDDQQIARALALNRFFGNNGSGNLENKMGQ